MNSRIMSTLGMCLFALACGTKNSATGPGEQVSPPQDLKALSINRSTVGLEWSPPSGGLDSTYAGYLVQWNGGRDSLGNAVLADIIDSLGSGESAFTVFSRKKNGSLSDGLTIRWAPADRFDSAYVLTEYRGDNPGAYAGLDAGSRNRNPSTTPLSPLAQATTALYLYGGSGQFQDPLELRSASLYQGNWNSTAFSTVTTVALSLDSYLSAFPPASTFTASSVTIVDNTVYYARVVGDPSEVNYVRLHVHIVPGVSPRQVEIRISLQRVPGLLYASDIGTSRPGGARLSELL